MRTQSLPHRFRERLCSRTFFVGQLPDTGASMDKVASIGRGAAVPVEVFLVGCGCQVCVRWPARTLSADMDAADRHMDVVGW